ncbi:uncharacterized protein LOC111375145 [Olea europaea var. sylvestris]|uniref:uncharacterized protein LOC111375145 n=1 Tax=Olea europaea var. sylvestris TaxID=158386 RepID=UPI000C1D8CBB|nr:uncharacterized protein LOC111375145 [Olea europaea var. sylvestris]
MPRGGKTQRLQDMLSQSHIAPNRDELRESERVDESVHQPPETQGQGNVIGTNPITVERIAIVVASAMRNTDGDFSIERATKLGAKVFIDTADPAVAQAWMTKIERVFDVMDCSDDQKLCLATFLLEEGAYDWWQWVRSTYLDPSIICWIDFRRIFYDAYYHRSYKDAKQEEFLKLIQGHMTIAEYQEKFIELSKYVQVLVSNEIDKCRRFENRLMEEIRSIVIAAGWNEFGKLVESALRVEKSIFDRPIGREQIMFRANVKENELKVNLIPLDIHDFDVILGMDFLTTNRASVDFFQKEVVFRQPGQPEVIFNGQRRILPSCVISAIDAKRLLNKGCHVYLTHVIDTDVSKLKLEDIPVVKDFPDVFPEELPGLPSDRDMEFTIDLIPGTAPISQAPYRMAPIELKELKVQLQ